MSVGSPNIEPVRLASSATPEAPFQGLKLVRSDGTNMPVDPRGVLLGSGAGCDLMLVHEHAKDRHALVWVAPGGPELVTFSRGATLLNGALVEGAAALAAGDRIEVPGETLTLAGPQAPIGARPPVWSVQVDRGRPWSLYRGRKSVGGADTDDLFVAGWPPAALLVTPDGDTLELRFGTPALFRADEVHRGEARRANGGDTVEVAGRTLQILAARDAELTDDPLECVRFGFLSDGGELVFQRNKSLHRIRLSELRARLVCTLLDNRYEQGEWVPDDYLLPRVWPRTPGKGRTDLNTLLHRVRQDLLGAGLDAFALLQRDVGATRFTLPPGVETMVA